MYRPRAFVEDDIETLLGMIDRASLAHLVAHGPDGFESSPLPVLGAVDERGVVRLRGHLARPNPLWRLAPCDALVVVPLSDAYVSPSWYPAKAEHGKVVPTWNYIAVHAYGALAIVDDAEWLRRLVTRLTDLHESFSAVPWKVTDAPAAFVDQMLKGIVGIELKLTRLEGKWKLSQNRPETDQAGTVAGLEARTDADSRSVAAAMHALRDK
jgi:transcriptional regulator